MNSNVFNEYLIGKYGEINFQNFHHFTKTITTTDTSTNITTTNTVTIDDNEYNLLIPSNNLFSLPTGDVVVNIDKSVVSIYDYEYEINESKRNIRLLNSNYVNQLETEFKNLMSA
jgi:hypothetical protein